MNKCGSRTLLTVYLLVDIRGCLHSPNYTINSHGSSSQEMKRPIALGKSAAKDLFKVLKSKDVTLKTKVRLTQATVFSIASYACESWTMNKEDRRIDAFELWCWRRILNIPWTAERMNKSVLEEVQPGCSLETRMARLCHAYFGHVVRTDQSLEKDIMLGRVRGQRKRGRPSMRQTDTVTATMSSSITTIFIWTLYVLAALSRTFSRTVRKQSESSRKRAEAEFAVRAQGKVISAIPPLLFQRRRGELLPWEEEDGCGGSRRKAKTSRKSPTARWDAVEV
ncbi:uncharacterized protein LOC135231414 isoform X2 [Loxodonta africana]|uniref:uncharacterized protein LOC135231414 isoform X2 n=2 Tax=Loxodonta africana TaxID=9785 RepID=UPI0030CE3D19